MQTVKGKLEDVLRKFPQEAGGPFDASRFYTHSWKDPKAAEFVAAGKPNQPMEYKIFIPGSVAGAAVMTELTDTFLCTALEAATTNQPEALAQVGDKTYPATIVNGKIEAITGSKPLVFAPIPLNDLAPNQVIKSYPTPLGGVPFDVVYEDDGVDASYTLDASGQPSAANWQALLSAAKKTMGA